MSITNLTKTLESEGLVFKLESDRLDVTSADQLKLTIRDQIDDSLKPVVIDMQNVTFIDSSGLGMLVSIRKHLGQNREMRLRNLNPFVQKALRLTRLDKVFTAL